MMSLIASQHTASWFVLETAVGRAAEPGTSKACEAQPAGTAVAWHIGAWRASPTTLWPLVMVARSSCTGIFQLELVVGRVGMCAGQHGSLVLAPPRFFQGMWRGRWSLLSVRWKGLSFRRGMQEVALLTPFCCVPRGRCGPSVAWLMSAAGSSIPALLISLTDTRAWVSSGFRASPAPVQGRRVPTGDYSDVSSSGGSRAIPL